MMSAEGCVPGIILASESPRRKDILSRMGLDFKVVPPETEEASLYYYHSLVPIINACRKAGKVSSDFPSSLVIGADTVIEFENRILGKPSSESESAEMLQLLSGRSHLVITGVCLIRKSSHARCVFCDVTEVSFRKLSRKSIEEYVRKVDTLDKAGAYAIQEHGDMIIEGTRGSFDNVAGLPSEKLRTALQSLAFGRVIRNFAPAE